MEIKKYDLDKLSLIFKEKILLNSHRIEDLKKYANEAQLTKEYLRPIAWKIFLGVLPNTTSLKEWIEIFQAEKKDGYARQGEQEVQSQSYKRM